MKSVTGLDSPHLEIERAIELLNAEDVIGLPTETVYGLAGSIISQKALLSIFQTKERPFFDPLIVHVASLEMLSPLVKEWTSEHQLLAENYWPGPLTIVVSKSERVLPVISAGLDTVALRMPNHPVALQVIKEFATPLAAPSANKFGKTSPTSKQHVQESFPNLFVLDGGPCEVGLESTVVKVKGHELEILRPGVITKGDFERLGFMVSGRSSMESPGSMKHHYQPSKPLVLVKTDTSDEEVQKQMACLLAGSSGHPIRSGKEELIAAHLSLSKQPQLAARELYENLRRASHSDVSYIQCRIPSHWEGGVWDALNDRIHRAATVVL